MRSSSRSRQGVKVRVVKSMLSDVRPHGAKPRTTRGRTMLNFPRWKVWGITLICAVRRAAGGAELPARRAVAASCRAWLQASASISASISPAAASCCSRRRPATSPGSGASRWRIMLRREMRRAGIRDQPVSTASNGQLSFVVGNPAQLGAAPQRRRAPDQPVGLRRRRLGRRGQRRPAGRRCARPRPGSTRRSGRRWRSAATSSTGASTRSARSSRRSSARAPTGSSSRCPGCRIRRR